MKKEHGKALWIESILILLLAVALGISLTVYLKQQKTMELNAMDL